MTEPDAHTRLKEDLVVVLVAPQSPENVGACARAMANMGLARLVVVAPAPSFDPERMRWMAPGAGDILERMRLVATMDEALEGVHRAVGTTARHRRVEPDVREPDEVAQAFFASEPGLVTAILFGREDTGLHNDELLRCGTLLRIPTAPHASLNLSQAVLLIGSRLFEVGRTHGLRAPGRLVVGRNHVRTTRDLQRNDRDDQPADLAVVEPLVQDALGVLERVGYLYRTSPNLVGSTLRELLQRAAPSHRELRALRGMVRRTTLALDRTPPDDG